MTQLIDCGANVGEFTRQLARTGAKVYAFEPEPTVKGEMDKVVEDHPNVKFFPAAVGLSNGRVNIFAVPRFSCWSSTEIGSSINVPAKVKMNPDNSIEIRRINIIGFIR